jgi:hypothetical protein
VRGGWEQSADPTLVAADPSGPLKREKKSPTKRDYHDKLTKWNPLKLSPSWDPFREMEEMQNRLSSSFGRPWPAWRSEPEEGFTLTEWMPPVDIEESDREYLYNKSRTARNEERGG